MSIHHHEPTDVKGCQEFAKNSESKVVVEEVVMPRRAVINDGAYDVLKYMDEQSKVNEKKDTDSDWIPFAILDLLKRSRDDPQLLKALFDP